MKWWPDRCEPGDMVRVSIGSIKHYGVFVSENEVIQFGPPPVSLQTLNNADICVCAATIEEFSCGNIVERAILDKTESRRRLSPKKTVEIARSRLGEKGYNLLHNNCEHFAYECVFGKKKSTQEEEARSRWNNRPIMDVYIAPLPENIQIQPVLSEAREAEIRNTGDPALQAARYYDWQVLLYAAERSFGLREDALTFEKTSGGKWTCPSFHFSLSHTDGAVVVGVSNSKIGVDVENIRSFQQKPYGSQPFLVKRMLKKISAGGNEDLADTADFLSLWLKKESIFKCWGGRFVPGQIRVDQHNATLFTLPRLPDLKFAVCGEKMENLRFYFYENGSARVINTEIEKIGASS